MSPNSLCLHISSFFRLCYDDCVQADAFLVGGRTRAEQTQDAGVMEAGRWHIGSKTQAEWMQDAGALEAGPGQTRG